VVLLYGGFISYDPKNPFWEKRDRLIISKGHGSLSMYPILADLNYFDKSIMISGNTGPIIGTDLSFGGGQYEYDVVVQDPNDLKKECHLTLNVMYDLFSCRRIEKVSTLNAQCDSLNGGIIIKRSEGMGATLIRLLDLNNNKEILLPVENKFIEEINHETKTIKYNAPEGLISLYLD
jgi:hypothetical protein